MRSSNLFLKTSNYLKTCPIRFPGAQSASLHPELPQGLLKVNSYSNTGFNLHRGRWQMPCSVIGNALGKCQFVVDRSLASYSSWGCKESDTTKQLTHTVDVTGDGSKV